MVRDQIECIVLHGVRPYLFEAALCRSNSPQKRYIEKKFYDDHASGGFVGPHFEIELFTDVSKYPHADKIHYHQTPANRIFVCWTRHLPNAAAATTIFNAWCAGTVYTIETGEDFAPLFAACAEDPQAFIERLARQNITVE